MLKRAHRDGELDEATYEAAQAELDVVAAELDVVADCLRADTPRSRRTLLVALRRLRGLVADVADLAAKLAVLIAAVKELA